MIIVRECFTGKNMSDCAQFPKLFTTCREKLYFKEQNSCSCSSQNCDAGMERLSYSSEIVHRLELGYIILRESK